jgi:hypothetical protein
LITSLNSPEVQQKLQASLDVDFKKAITDIGKRGGITSSQEASIVATYGVLFM